MLQSVYCSVQNKNDKEERNSIEKMKQLYEKTMEG